MIPQKLHFLARYTDNQWVVACLDFNLAAQDDTFLGAKARIENQIESYITMATEDPGLEFLLSRKAPLMDWVVFWFVFYLIGIVGRITSLFSGIHGG